VVNSDRFWINRPLTELSPDEWESLCDGCGKCCVLRFQDEDTGEIRSTDVACRYLDLDRIECTCYSERQQKVPECLVVTPANAGEGWLPPSCAYHLLATGKSLPEWHHLVCGDRQTIHDIGESVYNKVVSEDGVHPDEIEYRIQEPDD